MKKYHFDDADIKIDHKKEELEIIVNSNKFYFLKKIFLFYLIRLKHIKKILDHYQVEKNPYQHFVFN